jgi:hypothetical protein
MATAFLSTMSNWSASFFPTPLWEKEAIVAFSECRFFSSSETAEASLETLGMSTSALADTADRL